MEDHCLMHQMIALNLPDSDYFELVTGFILVNINVCGPDDKPIELRMSSQLDIQMKPLLIPPQVYRHYKQAHIIIFKGENLPKIHTHFMEETSIDAYVKLILRDCVLKTKVVNMKND